MSKSTGILNRIKNIAAHALNNDVVVNATKHELETRADYAVRVSLFGLTAATTSIVGGISGNENSIPFIISAGLASVSLIGLSWIRNTSDATKPFIFAGLSWVAGTSSMLMVNPTLAICGLGAALTLIGSSPLFRSHQKINTHLDSAKTISSKPADVAAKNNTILVDKTGMTTDAGTIGDLDFAQHEKLLERVHIADRVVFLRTLSQLYANEFESLDLDLRINSAASNSVPKFNEQRLSFSIAGDQIAIRQSENITPVVTEDPVSSDTRFLAIVSHELRTPLNAIIGFSDVLRGDLGKTLSQVKRDEYVNLINGAGTHLLSLVNTILDVSKIESGTYLIHREEFNFAETARESMAMLSAQAYEKNIHINDRMTGDLENVLGDRRALKQVLINLLSNAIKYTDNDGFVTIDAHEDEMGVTFEVSDTGIGMTESEVTKITKPFVQVDNSITRNCEGTGLGLALVKGLVDLHGGSLSIVSKPGVGTNVRVHIPRIETSSNSKDEMHPLQQLQDFLTKKNTDEEIDHDKRKVG